MFSRRSILAGTASLAATPLVASTATKSAGTWFDNAVVIDALGGIVDPYGTDDVSRLTDRCFTEMMQTGVTMLCDTIRPVGNVADPWGEYQKSLAANRAIMAANPDRLQLVTSAADILKAKREKRFGVLLGTQDSCMVGPDLDRVATMRKDGVLVIQLTYNNANLAGDGALEPRDGGLTKLGKATIERLEAEKVLLDLSHGGARTMVEAVDFAKRPLVISHTGARALNDHPRNTTDAALRGVADKGGVIGVYFMTYLAADMKPSGEALVAHIEHIANIAGEEHIGIGTDNGVLPTPLDEKTKKRMDDWTLERIRRGIAAPGEAVGIYTLVADYNTIDRYRRLADDLARRGWSQGRLEKLFGGNFLRVYRDAWGS